MPPADKNFTVEPAQQRPAWRSRVLAGLLVFIAAGVVTAGGYWWWLNTPPAMPTTADQARALIASARFRHLSPDRQADYLNQMRELVRALPEDQRQGVMRDLFRDEQTRQAMREAMRTQMVQRARAFAAADKAEQQRMVDEIIAQMGEMRSSFRGRGGNEGGRQSDWAARRAEREQRLAQMTQEQRQAEEARRQQERAQRQQERASRMEQQAATGNPQDRELISGMMRAVRQEMEKRGITPPGRNRPGRAGRQSG